MEGTKNTPLHGSNGRQRRHADRHWRPLRGKLASVAHVKWVDGEFSFAGGAAVPVEVSCTSCYETKYV
jgi:hypothetical protein